MAVSVTLDALGRSYDVPTKGEVDWTQLSNLLVDTVGVVNNTTGGSLVTPVFNVTGYGATGNGTTDDTASIRSAMAALAVTGVRGGTLYFPAGTYKTTGKLQFGVAVPQKNVIITGDGVSSVIKPTGAFSTDPVIEFRDCDYWRVTDLKVDCSARTGTGDAVLVDGCSYGFTTSTTIASSTRYGVHITQTNGASPPAYNYVEANAFGNNATANVHVKPGTAGNVVNQFSGLRPISGYVSVKDYGAVGDGVADDTTAIKAAIAALWRGASNFQGGTLFFPRGDYLVSDTLDFSGKTGFQVVGEGPQASRINTAAGLAGKDLIYVKGSQFWGVRDLALYGNAAARPSAMIHSRMEAGYVFASTGINFTNLLIYADADDAFDYGIRFSTDGSGNNSEVTYVNVTVVRAKESCFRKEGAQAKVHCFFGCEAAVSKVGVDCISNIGTPSNSTGFEWYGGGIGSCTIAGVRMDYPSDPTIIDGLGSEHCYRFLDLGTIQSAAAFPISIRNCRLDCAVTSPVPAFASWIRYSGVGPLIVEGNTITGGSAGVTLIEVSAAAPVVGRIVHNSFASLGSVGTFPVVNNSVFTLGLDIRDNLFATAGDAAAYRLEPLGTDTPSAVRVANTFGANGQSAYLLQFPLASFTSAAAAQTITALTLPAGAKVRGMYLYWHTRFALPGTPAITVKVGSTSGGDEYLLATDVSAADTQFTASLGTHLTTDYVQGGFVPSYFTTSPIYLTMTSGSGNLGTGSATRLTTGEGFLLVEVDTLPKWIL